MAVMAASVAAVLFAIIGFMLGRMSRGPAVPRPADEKAHMGQVLDQIADSVAIGDGVTEVVDPLAAGGRVALSRVLAGLRDHGGYEAVVLADDAGLVVAASGSDEIAEMMAIESAAFGSAVERFWDASETILHTLPQDRWTVHRYFKVDESRLSLSACRRGGSPRAEALDGALDTFRRVLTSRGSAVA